MQPPRPPGPVEGWSRLPSDGNSAGQGGTQCHTLMGLPAWQLGENKEVDLRGGETWRRQRMTAVLPFPYLCPSRSCRRPKGSAERQRKRPGIWPERKQRLNSCRTFSEIKRSRSVPSLWDLLCMGLCRFLKDKSSGGDRSENLEVCQAECDFNTWSDVASSWGKHG